MRGATARPGGTLIAQTTTNDPFHASTPGRLERSQWFAELYRQFEIKPGAHIRRIHYLFISQSSPLRMTDGRDYQNTEECWQAIKEAARDVLCFAFTPITTIAPERTCR
jgi:hypothetical protein